MKKKTNDLINVILGVFAIALMISGFFVYDKLTFIPEVTFCSSSLTEPLAVFLKNFCEIPILKRIVLILNTRLISMIAIYFAIMVMVFLILKQFGWKDDDI